MKQWSQKRWVTKERASKPRIINATFATKFYRPKQFCGNIWEVFMTILENFLVIFAWKVLAKELTFVNILKLCIKISENFSAKYVKKLMAAKAKGASRGWVPLLWSQHRFKTNSPTLQSLSTTRRRRTKLRQPIFIQNNPARDAQQNLPTSSNSSFA